MMMKKESQLHPPPPKKTRIYDTSEKELLTVCEGEVPKNTQSSINRLGLNPLTTNDIIEIQPHVINPF